MCVEPERAGVLGHRAPDVVVKAALGGGLDLDRDADLGVRCSSELLDDCVRNVAYVAEQPNGLEGLPTVEPSRQDASTVPLISFVTIIIIAIMAILNISTTIVRLFGVSALFLDLAPRNFGLYQHARAVQGDRRGETPAISPEYRRFISSKALA